MALPLFDTVVVGEALNTFGFTAYNTISGLGLITFGFQWECGNFWSPNDPVVSTMWTSNDPSVTTTWTPNDPSVTTTWSEFAEPGASTETCNDLY